MISRITSILEGKGYVKKPITRVKTYEEITTNVTLNMGYVTYTKEVNGTPVEVTISNKDENSAWIKISRNGNSCYGYVEGLEEMMITIKSFEFGKSEILSQFLP